MKIAYTDWEPTPPTIAVVDTVNSIIDEYQADGYTLTLRQLYYQFVARGMLENSERSYKNLGNTITKARMAGMVSWEAIEDRNRSHNSYWCDEDVMGPLHTLPHLIRFDRWARQDFYVEVWVEKEALGGVITRACEPYYVPHMSCKGYLSASEAWRAGMRFAKQMNQGKHCVLIHLGDHDPSGIDMTRDNTDRLDIFTRSAGYGVTVERIALNMDQIEEYDPPPYPAKVSDSRARDYIKKYGNTSWELDALEPRLLETLIHDQLDKYIDYDSWRDVGAEEKSVRATLENIPARWDEILPLLQGDDNG